MAKKHIANLHAKNYVDAVFAQSLLDDGFVCPDDKSLCWYRVTNGEIINSIFFVSSWSNLPLMLDIGYGIHPLFSMPLYLHSVQYNGFEGREICTEKPLLEPDLSVPMGYRKYSPDASVYAPNRGTRGLYTYQGIVKPLMDRATSVSSCYALHKESYASSYAAGPHKDTDDMFIGISQTFIDEAIFVDDVEIYPYCKREVTRWITNIKPLTEKYPQKKEYINILQQLEQQHNALFNDGREEYLSILEQRKAKTVRTLRKRFAIDIKTD